MAHHRANDQVERANGMILDPLKKRIYEKGQKHLGKWLKEVLAVVWGLRTQPGRNTVVSPYFMVFSSEAILPTDITFRAPGWSSTMRRTPSELRPMISIA